MIKTLYLLRHAQSADKQTGQTDKERELTPQGRLDALKIGGAIKKLNINFNLVLSSTALRAKLTILLVAEAAKFDTRFIRWNEELYEASLRHLMKMISELDSDADSVLLVGHNPALSYCVANLIGTQMSDLLPGSMATIRFPFTSWKEVKRNSGELVSYLDPNSLD